MSTITFGVIDTTCEAVDQTFFPPRVSLSTSATTSIATLLGYNEFIPSNPPKKYRTLSWNGTAEQVVYNSQFIGVFSQIADIKYVYSGAGSIDLQGRQISNYSKDMYLACPSSTFSPLINSNLGLVQNLFTIRGYCNPSDPQVGCADCNFPTLTPSGHPELFPNWANMNPTFVSNVSGNRTNDWPADLFDGTLFTVVNSTTATLIGSPFIRLVALQDGGVGSPQGLTRSTVNGLFTFWCDIYTMYNLSANLSDEYTDIDAAANAQLFFSNNSVAENIPRTTGFVTRMTTVTFSVNCSNLLSGKNYKATVDLWDMTANTHTQVVYPFASTGSTFTIHDSIPIPPAGHSVKVQNPTIAFAV